MVIGLDKFLEYFSGHEDKYAVIGGTACDLLFNAAGLSFRATKDIDIVLCVEIVDKEFGEQLSAFLKAGGYLAREQTDGKRQFYRFHQPVDKRFPFMIELFSRSAGNIHLPQGTIIGRIPVEEEVVSLSAILLEDEYYRALQTFKRVVSGITVLDERLLIPFKVRAFIDLYQRIAEGATIDSKQIKKHRNDIFRLLQLLPDQPIIGISEPIKKDLRCFIDLIGSDRTFDPKSFDVQMTSQEGIAQLRTVYAL